MSKGRTTMRTRLGAVLAGMLLAAMGSFGAGATEPSLPPPTGAATPRVEPVKTDEGVYHQGWFAMTFLSLADDFAEAKAAGKRFAVVFEQKGCPYCVKMHTDILANKYINDYVRENFTIVQLDLWGSREVTDFDGTKMPEKALAERWGVIFTPTIVFFKDDLTGLEGKWGRELEAIERLPLSYGRDTFYDLFVWVRHKVYQQDRNFQRFHIARIGERSALKAAPADKAGRTN